MRRPVAQLQFNLGLPLRQRLLFLLSRRLILIPVTLIPVTLIPVTLIPVTLIPVTLIPVTLIPVTLIPVTLIPVTLILRSFPKVVPNMSKVLILPLLSRFM